MRDSCALCIHMCALQSNRSNPTVLQINKTDVGSMELGLQSASIRGAPAEMLPLAVKYSSLIRDPLAPV